MASKNSLSGRLALAISLALASSLISIVVKAEENPYLRRSVVKPTTTERTNSVNPKIKVLTPGSGIAPVGADFHDVGPPGGPTFGEAKGPSFVNFKKPEQGEGISNPAILRTRPSAGKTFQQIQQQQH